MYVRNFYAKLGIQNPGEPNPGNLYFWGAQKILLIYRQIEYAYAPTTNIPTQINLGQLARDMTMLDSRQVYLFFIIYSIMFIENVSNS